MVFEGTDGGTTGTQSSSTGVATTGSSTSGEPSTSSTTTADDSTSSTGSSTGSSDESSSGVALGVCGNGVPEEGEPCDDGNTVNNDGCSNDCGLPGFGVWIQWFDGAAGRRDEGLGVATDGEGNIVVVGTTENLQEHLDIHIDKYAPDGSVLWTKSFDAGFALDDLVFGVATDSQDNIIVTGSQFVTDNGFDLWTAKYDADGLLLWEFTYNGPVASKDQGHAVAIDDADNIIIGGREFVPDQGRNAWIGKYDPDGVQQWMVSYDGPASSTDEVADVVVDGAGDIIVAGAHEVADQDGNIWVAKYDADGNQLWVVDQDGASGGEDFASGVAALPDGSVIVTGATQIGTNLPGNPIYDLWLGKYDDAGQLLWSETIDGPLGGDDLGEDVVADSQGNFILVGALAVDESIRGSVYYGQPPLRHGFATKYDADGNVIWTYEYGPKSEWTWAYAVAVDPIDNIFVTGRAEQAVTNVDQMLLKLAP